MELFQAIGATALAKRLRLSERAIYQRRRNIEGRRAIVLAPPTHNISARYPGRVNIEVKNGEVLVGSDFHIWPEKLVPVCGRSRNSYRTSSRTRSF